MKKTILVLSCCLFGWVANLFAQQGNVATGGDASGSNGNMSFSMGQVDYITASGSNGKITQGLQQPFEIMIYTGVEQTGINLTTSIYPNPTMQSLMLNIEGNLSANLTYSLYDELGKLLINKKVEGVQTTIDLSHLAAAKYFLKVTDNNKELKTFKVIKLN